MTENRPLRVFLCHSSNDKPVVRDLYRRLEAEGWVDAWLDEAKLYPGQDWNFEIEQAVEAADIIIVCLTKNSVNKEGYVQRELRIVLDLADYKPEGTLFIIPIRLEECEPPRRLRTWQYADYFPESDRDRAYQRLLVSLRMRAKRLDLSTENPAEVIARREAEERARFAKEKEEQDKRVADERARKESEAWARKEKEEEDRKVAEEKQKKAREQKLAGDRARKLADDKAGKEKEERAEKEIKAPEHPKIVVPRDESPSTFGRGQGEGKKPNLPPYGIGAGIILVSTCVVFGANYIIQNVFTKGTQTPTDRPPISTSTSASTHIVPTLGIDRTIISPKDDMVLVYVPAGEFTMGSDIGGEDAKPVHTVYLAAFWIDQTEVTNAIYSICVKDGECKEPSDTTHYFDPNYVNHPVVNVSWYDANAYCSWADRRLPTEAEWEKSASWNDITKEKYVYPWGNDFDCKKGNFDDETLLDSHVVPGGENCDGFPNTSPIKSFSTGVSPYGAFDMAGNVWEWVSSSYQSYPYSATDGREDLSASGSRVLRGGAWFLAGSNVRSTNRSKGGPSVPGSNFGFRCAVSE